MRARKGGKREQRRQSEAYGYELWGLLEFIFVAYFRFALLHVIVQLWFAIEELKRALVRNVFHKFEKILNFVRFASKIQDNIYATRSLKCFGVYLQDRIS